VGAIVGAPVGVVGAAVGAPVGAVGADVVGDPVGVGVGSCTNAPARRLGL